MTEEQLAEAKRISRDLASRYPMSSLEGHAAIMLLASAVEIEMLREEVERLRKIIDGVRVRNHGELIYTVLKDGTQP